MLIPNYGPHRLLAYVNDDVVSKSEADKEVRPFGVTCFLEDSRARTKHIYLAIGKSESFNVQTADGTIDFFLKANDSKQVVSILGGCHKANYLDAFQFVYPHVLRVLSHWSFRYRRPVGIYEVRVIDNRHRAMWGIPFAAPDTLPEIHLPIVTLSQTSLSSLVAVFREGMNSVSNANKFLSYFKILEAYPDKGPFRDTNEYCKQRCISISRQVLTVTSEMMKGAYAEEYHDEFMGKRATWCRDQLRDWRDAIAHPFLKGSMYIDLDTVEHQAKLGAFANLVERLSISILEDEFRLWGGLSGNPDYAMAARAYTGA